MARTAVTGNDYTPTLRKTAWSELLFRDTLVETYFAQRFAGDAYSKLEKGMPFESSPNDIIHIKEDLEGKGPSKAKGKGDELVFGLIPRIDPKTNAGVTSGQKLKGKEVALSMYYFSLELERYRQAVSAGTPLDQQRVGFDLQDEARSALKNWGVEKMDLLCFTALDVSTSTTFFYKTSSGVTKTTTAATAKSALTVADGKITPAMVSFMKAWAITGGARASGQIPLRPVKVGGRNYYVLLVHPDVMYDWKQDSTVFQAMREAEVRGKENPIFQGASYIWDNVVIHENENITIGTDAGSGSDVPYALCHFLGAQALCWAWGERPSIVEDTDDYEEDFFQAWRVTCKVGKPIFNSKVYGSFSVYAARTNVSGA